MNSNRRTAATARTARRKHWMDGTKRHKREHEKIDGRREDSSASGAWQSASYVPVTHAKGRRTVFRLLGCLTLRVPVDICVRGTAREGTCQMIVILRAALFMRCFGSHWFLYFYLLISVEKTEVVFIKN